MGVTISSQRKVRMQSSVDPCRYYQMFPMREKAAGATAWPLPAEASDRCRRRHCCHLPATFSNFRPLLVKAEIDKCQTNLRLLLSTNNRRQQTGVPGVSQGMQNSGDAAPKMTFSDGQSQGHSDDQLQGQFWELPSIVVSCGVDGLVSVGEPR
ncbi:hypothetical protein J6590_056489 [Homalodisca vitripennis]|nr:hypothetical protein J6590_056489 [Homalodisca vitripennis]